MKENWKVESVAKGPTLAELKIPRDIFQGKLTFSTAIQQCDNTTQLLNYLGWAQILQIIKMIRKSNQRMFMNYIKILAKTSKELEALIEMKIYIQHIGIEFDKDKYAVLIMESGKEKRTKE